MNDNVKNYLSRFEVAIMEINAMANLIISDLAEAKEAETTDDLLDFTFYANQKLDDIITQADNGKYYIDKVEESAD